MDKALKQRLVGASVIIALAVIVLPMLLSGRPESGSEQPQKMEIPPRPDELSFETRRFPVTDGQAGSHSAEDAHSASATTQQPLPTLPAVKAVTESGDADSTAAPQPPAAGASPDAEVQSQSGSAPDSALAPSTEAIAEQQGTASVEGIPAPDVSAELPGAVNPGSEDQGEPEPEPAHTLPAQAGNEAGTDAADRYVVQVASLSSAENANRLESQLKKQGFPVLRDTVESDLGKLNRLRVGPFATETEAAAASSLIKKEFKGVSPRVLDLKPGLVAPVTIPSDPLVRWVIQLGSFSDSGNAQKLVEQARGDGMTAYMETITATGATSYRVRVGPFLEREDAIRTQQKLLDDLKINGVVISAD